MRGEDAGHADRPRLCKLLRSNNLARHKIQKYTSIARPLDLGRPENRVLPWLLLLFLVLGAAIDVAHGGRGIEPLRQGLVCLLVVFAAWALARELVPDDRVAAWIAMAAGLAAALMVDSPGLLIAYVTLGLVRTVNRSGGLSARVADSILLTALSIWVIYSGESPFFGLVAALAFMLDGSLSEPLRRQWVFALLCLGATLVYLVDYGVGSGAISAPDTLFGWVSLAFLLIFILDALLLRRVRSRADIGNRVLDVQRVRGGMAVAFFAALQGISRPETVVVIVSAIAGICIGLAFRKSFRAPAPG